MSRTGRPRDDGGAGTLEYVGGTMVACVLVLALLLTAAATGVDAAVGFRNAICNALGLDCGSGDGSLADPRLPAEPCTVDTAISAGSGAVDIVVSLESGASLIVSRLSDGTYEVTLVEEDGLSASVGVGGGFTIDTGSGTIGDAASASLGGGVVFGSGMTWTGLTREEAEDIANDLKPAVQTAPTGPFRRFLRDAWELADGQDELRQPDQVFYEGGLEAGANAEVAFGPGGASAEATNSAIIGTRHDRTEDTYTVYLQAGLDRTVEAGLAFGPQASASIGGQAMIEVTVGEEGSPRSLVLSGEATTELFGQLGVLDGGDDSIFDDLSEQYTDPDNGAGGTRRTEARLALDLTNEENAQAAYGVLRAAGLTAVGQTSVTGGNPVGAARRLVQRFRDTGTLSLVEYDVDGDSYGASGEVKVGAEIGLTTGLEFETAVATRARYWDGQRLVDLPDCIA
ncbi:MAG: hypothetical protein M4D85_05775 [Actinomycetota bacterium]|nr:hypothetical protein [Actinomycetota bacterium]